MKKIIISLVVLSTLSGVAFAANNRDSNTRNSGYNQKFYTGEGSTYKKHAHGSYALKALHEKAKISDQSIGLQTNYYGEYIN